MAGAILDTGGFVCWVVLVQIHLQALHTNLLRVDERKKINDLCYNSGNAGVDRIGHYGKHKDAEVTTAQTGVIANRQHNGLGNQMFQYVFSRLAAESLGRDWTTSEIVPSRG